LVTAEEFVVFVVATLTDAIRAHAREVSGFVHDGMPAMMHDMMGGPGGMMGPDP
jgi:hypothetical protein